VSWGPSSDVVLTGSLDNTVRCWYVLLIDVLVEHFEVIYLVTCKEWHHWR
jgi:WD40 repeat protein